VNVFQIKCSVDQNVCVKDVLIIKLIRKSCFWFSKRLIWKNKINKKDVIVKNQIVKRSIVNVIAIIKSVTGFVLVLIVKIYKLN
jgi:hypothetical protein